MSTFKYYTASNAFGTAQINWLTNTICALLVNSTYAPSQAKDQYVSDIPSAAIIARSAQLTSKAITNGVCRGLIPEFDALVSLLPAAALILYVNSSVDDSSQLIYYSSDGFGFPFLPQGLNYFVTYDQANGGYFQL